MKFPFFDEKYLAASSIRDPVFRENLQARNDNSKEKVQMVICVEELSELLQAISKYYYQKENKLNLIEKLGSLLTCIETMKQLFSIRQEEFESAECMLREQWVQDYSNDEMVILFIREITVIMQEISECCINIPNHDKILQILIRMSVCFKDLCDFFSITAKEIDEEISVGVDRDIYRLSARIRCIRK